MILNKFGTMKYDGYTLPNITTNLGLTYDLIKSQFIFREYTIVGAPRPEQLSHMIYGSTDYEWVLLLVNGVIDPWYGWIKPDDVVRAYAEKKYATFGGAEGTHHYIDPQTGEEYYDLHKPDSNVDIWYNTLDTSRVYPQFEGALIRVTNVEYEIDENEKLRKIIIVRPSDIRSFVDAFERTHNGRS